MSKIILTAELDSDEDDKDFLKLMDETKLDIKVIAVDPWGSENGQ